MPTPRRFEKHLEERLQHELEDRKDFLTSSYLLARDKLTKAIFSEVKGVERHLSDHSEKHVANVLDNIHYLLSDNHTIHGLTAIELYCLAMITLFHDVGNLFGREGHRTKLGDIFDWARGTDADIRHEKTLILRAARAHTGVAADGTYDTLKEVDENEQLHGEAVRLRELAAILRFADELAEGPQRTSEYLRRHNLYEPDSAVFHDYASITHIRPDRGTGRILVTYEVEVSSSASSTGVLNKNKEHLTKLLQFTYERALKLDQERRYAKFYSRTLSPFAMTRIGFNFHCQGQLLSIDLPPIVLEDKIVPGDPARSLPEREPAYRLDTLIPSIVTAASQR